MGVGRDMEWARYTRDNGTFASVKINKANSDHALAGFAGFNPADPYLPAKYMRNVVGTDGVTGDTQKLYIGAVASTLWTEAATEFTYPRLGEPDLAPLVTFQVILKHAESTPKPRTIVNI